MVFVEFQVYPHIGREESPIHFSLAGTPFDGIKWAIHRTLTWALMIYTKY